MTETVVFETHNDIAVIRIDNPPVNALSQSVRQGLLDSVSQLDENDKLTAAVLICSGRTFIAGADISEFGKEPLQPHLPDVLRAIGQCKKPIVAAMHGTVLGGGFETALACDYRVSFPNTKVGLPEVKLGLIPGAFGTQLLPRLAGVKTALDMVTSGRQVLVDSELGQTLVDEVILGSGYDELLEGALNFAQRIAGQTNQRRWLADVVLEKEPDHEAVFAAYKQKMAKKKRGLIAAQHCVQSVENAVVLPFEQGAAEERRLFMECRESSQSQAMRHAFFAERKCAKVDGLDTSASALPVKQVGVIGAGTMGVGIAMCFAQAGMPVTLLEVDQDRVNAGLEKIQSNYERSVARGRITEEQSAAYYGRVRGTCNYDDLADVDLVIEAAFESMEVKNQIFSTLDKVCKPDTIFATNTSYLDIDAIATVTNRQDKVLGMHFFSPAHIMKLLEIVRAEQVSDQTLVTAIDVARKIGKVAVTVGVCYGFVGNRMYARYGAEAQNLLLEGATPELVDAAIREWGMAMGPFEVIDLTGLDIGYKARKHQPNLPDDPTYFALSTVFVEAGRLGQKSGSGFYSYGSGSKQPDQEAINLIRDTATKLGVKQIESDAREIQNRLIGALVDEGRAILKEGIAQQASDIDVIWLNGYGFPRHRGGPMWYGDEAG
ncbi:MAG: 3-hydroxyacyl-CoA dehydrogenase NAD-binding domain-containing protein, partial [Pseudomonadota bacterium]